MTDLPRLVSMTDELPRQLSALDTEINVLKENEAYLLQLQQLNHKMDDDSGSSSPADDDVSLASSTSQGSMSSRPSNTNLSRSSSERTDNYDSDTQLTDRMINNPYDKSNANTERTRAGSYPTLTTKQRKYGETVYLDEKEYELEAHRRSWLDMVKLALRTAFALMLLACITIEALVGDAAVRCKTFNWRDRREIKLVLTKRLPKYLSQLRQLCRRDVPLFSIYDAIEAAGYRYELHHCVTKDGYILGLHRLVPPTPPKVHRGPVICMHGLFNTGIVWVLSGRGKSLAFILADLGYDVWLGNVRSNHHSRQHTKYTRYDKRYWDYTLDTLTLDVEAMYEHVLKHTPDCEHSNQIVWIGHSQGSAMWLQAAATKPHIDKATRLAVLLSPAAYVQSLASPWLRGMTWLHINYPRVFLALMGELGFMPVMENARNWVPAMVFTHLGALHFEHLFNWQTKLWEKDFRGYFFSETPSLGSVHLLAHHLQNTHFHTFSSYFDPRKPQQKPVPHDLTKITSPVALFGGSEDQLIHLNTVAEHLSNCVYKREIDDYFHLDLICAASAYQLVYPQVVQLMKKEHKHLRPARK